MTNTKSCISTLQPTPCIAVLMDYCWSSACVCGPGPPHRVGVLCVGVHHPAKQRFGGGRHNAHFKNSNVT